MIINKQLADYLQDYLACGNYKDYIYNGLQVEGAQNIQNICTAVTISQEIISQAIELQANALLVHHGLFWRGEDMIITGMNRKRIAALLSNNINLFAYHLPLDCHQEIGNNICLAKKLNIKIINQHSASGVANLLWFGEFQRPISIVDLQYLLNKVLSRDPIIINANHNKLIHKIAWCSGGAHDLIVQAAQLGADAFLSGEIAERTFYQAHELGIHYFSCGHHATELFGIQELGQLIANKYELNHHFLNSYNPI